MLLATLFGMFPFLLKLYADGGYQGPEFQKALKRVLSLAETQIVKRSDREKGFVVLPRRWVVDHRTMLPVWGLNGPHSLNVRAVGGRKLLRRSSRQRVELVAGESELPQVLMRHRRPAFGSTADGGAHGPIQGSPSAARARIVRSDKIECPTPDRGLRSPRADRSARSPAVEPPRRLGHPNEDSESGR